MKADTYTVQQVFERNLRYIVPLYQRPYVWKHEDQWQPLWDDIRAMLDHQEVGDPDNLWTHFLGAIVLDSEKLTLGELPRFIVIDGQQRLTTLQLLLAAAARALATAGAEKDAALLRSLVFNDELYAEGIDRLKVWPTNINRDAFVEAMSVGQSPTDTKNLIYAASIYFEQQVADYLAGDEDDEEDPAPDTPEIDPDALPKPTPAAEATGDQDAVQARARWLRLTLCQMMKIVSIELEETDNAQVIFETLNARGTPLLALDLTKNALFAEAQRQHLDRDELYENVWRPQLDDEYWREPRRQGRLFRPVGELFLMHWLTMRTSDLVPATELFATFRRRALATSKDAAALIQELCDDAAVMRSFDPGPANPEPVFFQRLAALDAGTVLPLVLLLFRSPEVSVERRHRALRMLESWLTRRSLMRLTAKNYNRLVPRLVAKLATDLEHADDQLLAALGGGEGEISRWPTDSELRAYLINRPTYGWVAQPRLVMVLAAVEESLYSNKVDVPTLASGLSLEHLMPQEWAGYWEVDPYGVGTLTDEERADIEKARGDRLHQLGNLTIVAAPLNSSMSNGPWEQKRKDLNHHSKLLLNAHLADTETWDLDAIDTRTQWVVDRIIEIFPGPAPAGWS